MNKKLFAVLSTAGIAATFWACGSGEIYEPDTVDDVVKSIVDNGGAASLCLDAKDLCTPASEVSSSSEAISSAAKPKSSSSRVVPTFESSSSGPSIIPTLSSSSTTPVDPTAIGTCTPNPTTIKRDGGSASFKFVANAGANIPIAGTKYEWDFGSTATPSTFTGMTPSGVTFSKSGSVIAKVNVTYGGLTKTVACSPLQVNGADITGCKCAPASDKVDVAVDGTATWTVTGCSSVGANIIGYAWSGATGEGATASRAFTAKGDAFSPTVVVSNDDNSKQEVVCDPVKPIDSTSPDFKVTKSRDNAINLPGGVDLTVIMDIAWQDQNKAGVNMRCNYNSFQAINQKYQGEMSGTVDGEAVSGTYNLVVSLPVSSTKGGYALPMKFNKPAAGDSLTCSFD